MPSMILMISCKTNRKQQGIALVIVLWMLALMTIMALTYSGMTRNESLLNSNMIHAAQARAKAESGVWLAVNDIIKPIKSRRFLTNGSPIQTSPDRIISIHDESGKIDLNKASQQLLIGLIKTTGMDFDQSNQIVDAILDWRDRDHLRKVNGAEDNDYETNGYAYGAKDGEFNSIGELLQIHGINLSLYKKLEPLITVHSMQSRIRLNSAPIGVLRALPDLSEEIIAQIMTDRIDGDTKLASLVLPDITKPLVFTSGRGVVFSIISEAKINNITSRLKVTLALKRSGNNPITILDWQENAPALTTIDQQEYSAENMTGNTL